MITNSKSSQKSLESLSSGVKKILKSLFENPQVNPDQQTKEQSSNPLPDTKPLENDLNQKLIQLLLSFHEEKTVTTSSSIKIGLVNN